MINELKKIQEIYKKGGNVIDYIKKMTSENSNSTEAIMISYDMQAGSYIKYASENYVYINNYTNSIAKIIDNLGDFESIIEIGVGEATTFANVVTKLKKTPKEILGFDISWSRVKYAQQYLKEKGVLNFSLFTGDLFNTPINDNSIDIVYTSHSIEPNGGKEKEALQELYRITNKYLILLEPSYYFANEEGKKRMERLGYVKRLYETAIELNYKIIEHRLFEYCSNPLNPTGLIIIEKNGTSISNSDEILACPISKTSIKIKKGSYFSPESLLVYPIIDNIPCLLPNNAVIAAHY